MSFRKENKGFGKIKWTMQLNGRNLVYELSGGMSRFHIKSNKNCLPNLKYEGQRREKLYHRHENRRFNLENLPEHKYTVHHIKKGVRKSYKTPNHFKITKSREMEAFHEKAKTLHTTSKTVSRQMNLLKY